MKKESVKLTQHFPDKRIKDFESIYPNAWLNSKQLYQTGGNDQQHKQVELKSSPRFLEKPKSSPRFLENLPA